MVELSGPVVTRSFDTFFYMENLNRAAGTRINCAAGQTPAAEGTSPKVRGVVRIVDGERAIDEATVVPGGGGSVLPLGMKWKGRACGPDPQGLLVGFGARRTCLHRALQHLLWTNGSGQPVRVELHGTAAPVDKTCVGITGAMGPREWPDTPGRNQ